MRRKDSQSKPTLVLGVDEFKLMPLLRSKASGKKVPKKFKKDVDTKLKELCSKHKIKNKEAFIKALYEEVGLREYLFRSYTVKRKKQVQTRYLEKLEDHSSKLLDTIVKGQNRERGIRSTAWELGINKDLLRQLEAVLGQLPAEIKEARDRVNRLSPSNIKALWRCYIARDIHRVFDRFNIPATHHEDSAYYGCIKIILASMDAEIDSVRSFMSNCRKLTGNTKFYKP